MANVEERAWEPASGRIKRPQGLVEEIYGVIRSDILSLKIPPDSRISVDDLARKLGTSQTPIREALSMLEAINLVTRKHFVGYCSAPRLSRKQFAELYEIRLLVEPFAARRAAECMSDAELQELHALVHHVEPGDPCVSNILFADHDTEFHERVARGSGNALIEEVLAQLHAHIHIARLRFHCEVTTDAFAEHTLIMQSLQRRSPGDAEAAMREHIEKSYHRLAPFTDDPAAPSG